MSEYSPRFVVCLRFLALGLAVAGAAGPLYAGVPAAKTAAMVPFTADTAAPAKQQGVVSAAGLNWLCQGLRCTTSGVPTLLGIGSCQALAREVGRIGSFASSPRALSAAELSQCNAAVNAGPAAMIGTPAPAPAAGLPAVPHPSPASGGAPAEGLSAARTSGGKSVVVQQPKSGTVPAVPPKSVPTPLTVIPKPDGQAQPPGGSAAPARVRIPASVRTSTLRVVGTGSLPPASSFAPKSVRTGALVVVGTGSLGPPRSFTPKAVRTGTLVVHGTGGLE